VTLSAPVRPPVRGRSSRLDSLTGLRFFAAFAVVLLHSWWAFSGNPDLGLLDYAYTAVGFFFTLSGVVLAWSWRAGTGVVVQWRRRAARILPLHWLTLGLILAIYLLWPATHPVADTKWALVANAALLQAWPPFDHLLTFNFPSWSLSTEAFCYLLFPFLMWGLARLPVRRLLQLAAVLVVAYVVVTVGLHLAPYAWLTDRGILALPPVQFLKFATGACVGAALRLGWRPRVPVWAAMAALAAAVLALPVLTSAGLMPEVAVAGGMVFADLVIFVPMLLVIVAVVGSDLREITPRTAFLRWGPLVRLGEWSFALYLVHASVLYVYYAWRLAEPGRDVLGLGWLPVYLLVCVGLSGLLHTMFERPIERWIRRREPVRPIPVRVLPIPAQRMDDSTRPLSLPVSAAS
jgi:peptidoglycan/LPS O-acetylase OafA/YrhL